MVIGSTISHYRIVEKLGEGGMGVVYKAEDTKLERTVALKFLAEHLLSDAEAKERFLREAKASAALHHSNVCPVHEIDEVDGKTFLAMAFLDGEPLENRIAQGPMPIKEALDIARQVAEGLQAAHEKGIVHRDIKPANIMVDAKGHATIMDFGLARLTEASRLTRVDTAMGTVAYMSPEQAQGMDVDSRTDVWALGCVLYEMVSGQRPFQGQYDQALLYEIVHEEVAPLTSIRAGVPMELEFIVGKCLAKDRDDRTSTAHEVSRDLRTLGEKLRSGRSTILRTSQMTGAVPAAIASAQTLNPATTLPPDAIIVKRRSQRALQGLAAVLGLCLLGALGLHFTESAPAELPTIEFSIEGPQEQLWSLAISPDGRDLVMTAGPLGTQSLWVRALASDEWRKLDGTEGAGFPFWSPDSRQVGFFAEGRLKKIAAAGGPSQSIAEAENGRGGSWGEDGTILFAPGPFAQLQRISAEGGEPTPVTQAEEDAPMSRRFPQWLPGGKHFLYSQIGRVPEQMGIFVGSLDGSPPKRLAPGEGKFSCVRPTSGSQTGHLLFVREGALMAQPFDAARLEVAGGAVALPVSPRNNVYAGNYSFAVEGTALLAHVPSAQVAPARLVWVDRSGTIVERTDLIAEGLRQQRLSPDGQRVAYVAGPATKSAVWVYDLARKTQTRLSDRGGARSPVWSPDGQQVAFASEFGPDGRVLVRSADGGGIATSLVADGGIPLDWSSDGKYLLFSRQNTETGSQDLWILERTDDGAWEPRPFLATLARESGARLSPNGRYIAYSSDDSGRPETYVQPFPEGGGRTVVSTGGSLGRLWSRDGKELFNQTLSLDVVAIQVTTEGDFALKNATTLFSVRDADLGGGDVSLDGQRFLVTLAEEQEVEAAPDVIHIVQNWQAKYLPQR